MVCGPLLVRVEAAGVVYGIGSQCEREERKDFLFCCKLTF